MNWIATQIVKPTDQNTIALYLLYLTQHQVTVLDVSEMPQVLLQSNSLQIVHFHFPTQAGCEAAPPDCAY